ncbi:hypothetical protein N8611_01830 [bacterium]|nr:hypothetical protein [Verrucomicrobiota bacterium]MDA7667725.1 hypothetical protein [bacterium]
MTAYETLLGGADTVASAFHGRRPPQPWTFATVTPIATHFLKSQPLFGGVSN